jgi:hypothetical protein
MKRFFPIVLLLGGAVTSLRASNGHNFSGLAVVSPPRGSAFVAAFTMEDFDPNHVPELHLQNLWKLTLVPFARSAVIGERFSGTCETSGGPTAAGHLIMNLCGFMIELIPVDEALRRANAQAAIGFVRGPAGHREFIVTYGGPANSDGSGSDTIQIVGIERE